METQKLTEKKVVNNETIKNLFFVNSQLQFEIEKHISADEIVVKYGKDENLEKPYFLEVNDDSYFYYLPENRADDIRELKKIFK